MKTTKKTHQTKKKIKSPFYLEGFNSKSPNKLFKMFKSQASCDGERSAWKSVLSMKPFKIERKLNG